VPDGDGHRFTRADGRPRVDVAGKILVRSLKTERSALRSALQEVTAHDGPVLESKAGSASEFGFFELCGFFDRESRIRVSEMRDSALPQMPRPWHHFDVISAGIGTLEHSVEITGLT
jgi:hypothetical protein